MSRMGIQTEIALIDLDEVFPRLAALFWIGLAVALLGLVFKYLIGGRATAQSFPYQRRKNLFSEAEMEFLRVLEVATGEAYRVVREGAFGGPPGSSERR